ncbi:MAG: cupredoxin domain-containing protein, partial [Thaumarchaeota archaeon]|nr:cupredoxin domain-containing protein [Nitrososphaerota archaeon]
FDKEIINVKTDDTITWINQDSSPHTITSGAGPDDQQSAILFDSGFLSQDQKYSFRVSQLSPGTYDYYCLAHPFMKGKFIIK